MYVYIKALVFKIISIKWTFLYNLKIKHIFLYLTLVFINFTNQQVSFFTTLCIINIAILVILILYEYLGS